MIINRFKPFQTPLDIYHSGDLKYFKTCTEKLCYSGIVNTCIDDCAFISSYLVYLVKTDQLTDEV